MAKREIMQSIKRPVFNFVFTAATTTASETMTIPCQNVGVFNATIDWGDGIKSAVTAYNDAGLSHVYESAGTYKITVSGIFPNVYFGGNATMAAKVKTVESLGSVGWLSLFKAFTRCSAMTYFEFNGNTSNVTDMAYMFFDCSALTAPSVIGFDTSSVTNTSSMFYGCSSVSAFDLGGWNTSNVTNMSYMFYNCTSATIIDVSGFDTSSVTSMSNMFNNCTSATIIDVSGFDTSSVTSMGYMFNFCTSVSDLAINVWDISNVTNLTKFAQAVTLPTIRYDATLIAWDALTVQPSLAPHFGSSTYTLGGAAEAARSSLITNDLWTITDGGGV